MLSEGTSCLYDTFVLRVVSVPIASRMLEGLKDVALDASATSPHGRKSSPRTMNDRLAAPSDPRVVATPIPRRDFDVNFC